MEKEGLLSEAALVTRIKSSEIEALKVHEGRRVTGSVYASDGSDRLNSDGRVHTRSRVRSTVILIQFTPLMALMYPPLGCETG